MTHSQAEAWDPDGAQFDLSARTARSLVGAAAVGLVLGVVGWVSIIAAVAAGQHPPVAGLIVIGILCTPLLAFGVLCAVNIVRLRGSGGDALIVEAAGLRRTARTRGFAVAWPEIERIDVVASEGVAGYWSYGLDGGRRRRAGTLTALRLQPVDPARFAVDHPTLVSDDAAAVLKQAVAAPFGLAFAMTDYPRGELVAALHRYAGTRFGAVLDETTSARRRGK